ncbi:PH domain-containing protein [Exiguobacterium sp. s193]|uniref:PH domain-containing protein n=1 Tax=Exiguobacterium sp. s193 TaxID=2751207 RepID=UPI001BE76240|nr:PH domain-containing protein [Exiguobacterium sp. s193]
MTRRVHPLFILMSALTHLRSTIIPLGFLLFNDLKNEGFGKYTLIGFCIFCLVLLLFGVASWYFYTFTIDDQSIRVNKGIFRKSERTTQRRRIESIGINQNLLERVLGLATLSVETSSDGIEPEVELKGVRLKFATSLKATIKGEDTQTEQTEATDSFRVSLNDLFFAGALSGRLGLALVGFFAGYQLIDQYIEKYVDRIFNELAHLSLLLLSGLGLLILLLVYLGSIIVYVVRYGSFEATLNEKRLTIRYGLLNRTEVVFHQDKVQALLVEENWIKRRFKRAHLSLNVISATGKEEQMLFHPFIREADIDPFLERFLPRFERVKPMQYAADHGFFYVVRWRLVWYMLLFSAVNTGLIYFLTTPLKWAGLLLYLILPIYYMFARTGYRNTCYGFKQDVFVLRRQLVNRHTIYAPRLKIEALSGHVSRFLEQKDLLKFEINLRGRGHLSAGYFTHHQFEDVRNWYQRSFLKTDRAEAGDIRYDNE